MYQGARFPALLGEPGAPCTWPGRLTELLGRYTRYGLSYQGFTSSRFVRLRRIRELMAAGELDGMLRRPAVVA
jgi:hypothetical protein